MTFYEEQAEKFLDFAKSDGRGFNFWADSKGFTPVQKAMIRFMIERKQQEKFDSTSEPIVREVRGE